MNILDYLNKYKDISFEEKEFNNTEAALFILLSYARFEDFVPSFEKKDNGIAIKDLTEEQIKIASSPKMFGEEIGVALCQMVTSIRYKDIIVRDSMSVSDVDALEQFSALTFIIPSVGNLVTFRGTDGTLEGWKENFSLLYTGATLAQIDAIEYLHQIMSIHAYDNLILAGHSKGGNLAMYSLFLGPKEIKEKISHAYSFDGHGFPTKSFKKVSDYQLCMDKLTQIVPKESIVGEMFYTPQKFIIIDSLGSGIGQHHPMNWLLNDVGEFITVEKRTFKTRLIHRVIKKWSQACNKNNYQVFVEVIIASLQTSDGQFSMMAKDDESKLKKIKRALKKLPKKERRKFGWVAFLLVCKTITSLLYYLFLPIISIFKRKDK